MTPEERELISSLFDRMRGVGAPEKDREAEALISERVRSTPDSAYMLVQSVLVQEHALQEAEARIRELEDRVLELQNAGQPRTSGSFLGGLLGGGRPASQPTVTSVPPIGSRATPSAYDDPHSYRAPGAAPSPQPPPAPAASGGFMRSAMATAAGVAGGVLAAGAIRDLLGGNSANANTAAAHKENSASGIQNADQAGSANARSPVENARDEQAGKGTDDASYEEAYDDDDSGWDDTTDLEI